MKWRDFILKHVGNPDFHGLDENHTYKFIYGDATRFEDKGWPRKHDTERGMELVIVGIMMNHRTSNNDTCGGYCTFAKPLNPSTYEAKAPTWKVQSLSPLTISPSIQCRTHPEMHGFIQNGKWVQV